jgi:hypothetical protein
MEARHFERRFTHFADPNPGRRCMKVNSMGVSTLSAPALRETVPRSYAGHDARSADDTATRRAASRLVASFLPHIEANGSFIVHFVGTGSRAGVTHVTAAIADVAREMLEGSVLRLEAAVTRNLGLADLRARYADLRLHHRLVIVGCPSVCDVPASAMLSTLADQTLLVVRAEHSRADEVALSARLLREAGVTGLATVLNGERRRLPACLRRLF